MYAALCFRISCSFLSYKADCVSAYPKFVILCFCLIYASYPSADIPYFKTKLFRGGGSLHPLRKSPTSPTSLHAAAFLARQACHFQPPGLSHSRSDLQCFFLHIFYFPFCVFAVINYLFLLPGLSFTQSVASVGCSRFVRSCKLRDRGKSCAAGQNS